jgi:hypothetical protein
MGPIVSLGQQVEPPGAGDSQDGFLVADSFANER